MNTNVQIQRLYRSFISTALSILALAVSFADAANIHGKEASPAMNMRVSSNAFQQGQSIPKIYTADGGDISPLIAWNGAVHNVQSYALICDDPDAPMGTWVHWVIYDIPGSARKLKQGVPKTATLPDGSKQGKNSWNNVGYGGPSPPPGKAHRYYFKLYALDTKLNLPADATTSQLIKAMNGHVTSQAELMGMYGR